MRLLVAGLILGSLLLSGTLQVATATEWCRAAPEDGKPEYGVCLPSGEGSARYMIEVTPVIAPGIDLQ